MLLLSIQYLTQGLFYSRGFRGGQAGATTCTLLNYVGHSLTRCNVSQVILLELKLTKYNMSLAHMPAHRLNLTQRSSAVLSMIVCSPKGGLAEAGGHSALNLSMTLWGLKWYCLLSDSILSYSILTQRYLADLTSWIGRL